MKTTRRAAIFGALLAPFAKAAAALVPKPAVVRDAEMATQVPKFIPVGGYVTLTAEEFIPAGAYVKMGNAGGVRRCDAADPELIGRRAFTLTTKNDLAASVYE